MLLSFQYVVCFLSTPALINDNKSWDEFLYAQFVCEGKQAESVKHTRFFLP